jgi:hypothetical protein
MPDRVTLGELAAQVRSKNAGPFWITLDVFFASEPDYRLVTASAMLAPQVIGRLYQVDPAAVRYFELPGILAVKISFPRPVTAGSFSRPRPARRPAARPAGRPSPPGRATK